jgi:Ca-activated chloride channel homolog
MEIHSPAWLWLLILDIPLFFIFVTGHFRGKRDLKTLVGGDRFEAFAPVYAVKSFFTSLFGILFFTFAAFSLSDPRFGERLVEDDRSGREIVFALDISNSMLARDVMPSRLEQAKAQVNSIMDAMPDTKFGLILFKGKAVRVWPVTDDVYSIRLFLDTVEPGLITVPGTNLEDAINTGLAAFKEKSSYRAIVLLSDGDSLAGDAEKAAAGAQEAGVPILTIPFGTKEGGRIALDDLNVLKDREGKPVETRADAGLLSRIASASGGRMFEPGKAGSIRNEFMAILKGIEKENADKGLRIEKGRLHGLFLFLALASLVCLLVVRGVKWMNTF